jgi:hypothetical protein
MRSPLETLKIKYPKLAFSIEPVHGKIQYVVRGGADFDVIVADTTEGLRAKLEGDLQEFDPTRPNIARVYDYLLGGKDNFEPDRQQADKLARIYPQTAELVRENRQFLSRAVTYVAGQGIRQFIDVGAGLPTMENTHELARHVHPDARVAYVDNDPVVLRHAEALLQTSDGVIAVPGNLTAPSALLLNEQLNRVINMEKPICIILALVLHFVDADTGRRIVAIFRKSIAPGSYLIISVGRGDGDIGERIPSEYAAASLQNHSREEVRAFFEGLDVVWPGVTEAYAWQPRGPLSDRLDARSAQIWAGVGRVTGR